MPTLKRALLKSIKIGSVDYKIILKDFDTRFYMGMFVPMKAEIHIHEGLPYQVQVASLMHEIQHAILWSNGDEKENDDEGFVERTSVAWLAIFNQLKDKI